MIQAERRTNESEKEQKERKKEEKKRRVLEFKVPRVGGQNCIWGEFVPVPDCAGEEGVASVVSLSCLSVSVCLFLSLSLSHKRSCVFNNTTAPQAVLQLSMLADLKWESLEEQRLQPIQYTTLQNNNIGLIDMHGKIELKCTV